MKRSWIAVQGPTRGSPESPYSHIVASLLRRHGSRWLPSTTSLQRPARWWWRVKLSWETNTHTITDQKLKTQYTVAGLTPAHVSSPGLALSRPLAALALSPLPACMPCTYVYARSQTHSDYIPPDFRVCHPILKRNDVYPYLNLKTGKLRPTITYRLLQFLKKY